MNLNDFLKEQSIKLQPANKNEIAQLFRITFRDLRDAQFPELSSDRKFATAYNAGLQLATIILRAKGYRTNPQKAGHHRVCIQALPLIMGKEWKFLADYFDLCRIKRHACEYTSADEVEESEALQLVKKVDAFRIEVIKWLKKNHPELVPEKIE